MSPRISPQHALKILKKTSRHPKELYFMPPSVTKPIFRVMHSIARDVEITYYKRRREFEIPLARRFLRDVQHMPAKGSKTYMEIRRKFVESIRNQYLRRRCAQRSLPFSPLCARTIIRFYNRHHESPWAPGSLNKTLHAFIVHGKAFLKEYHKNRERDRALLEEKLNHARTELYTLLPG